MKVVRSGDLVSYCAEEGVRILGEGKFLVSDSFPGNERTKYCLTSKVYFQHIFVGVHVTLQLSHVNQLLPVECVDKSYYFNLNGRILK